MFLDLQALGYSAPPTESLPLQEPRKLSVMWLSKHQDVEFLYPWSSALEKSSIVSYSIWGDVGASIAPGAIHCWDNAPAEVAGVVFLAFHSSI